MDNPAFLLPLHPLYPEPHDPWHMAFPSHSVVPSLRQCHCERVCPVSRGSLKKNEVCNRSKKTNIATKNISLYCDLLPNPFYQQQNGERYNVFAKDDFPMKKGEGHITCFYHSISNSTTTQWETVHLPIVPLWKCHFLWLVHGRLMVWL